MYKKERKAWNVNPNDGPWFHCTDSRSADKIELDGFLGNLSTRDIANHPMAFLGLSSDELDLLSNLYGRRSLPLAMYKAVKDGEVVFQATLGRLLLDRVLSDKEKLEILSEEEVHVAHTGSLRPDESWRIDKRDSARLESDGSNFFEIAEKVD